jgi:diguanylate cyclase (GGDEF)-like protein
MHYTVGHSTGAAARTAVQRTLPSQITLAVFLTGLAAVVPLILATIWSMGQIDSQSVARERLLIERAIAEAVDQVLFEQRSISIWDDAVIYARDRDQLWMEENIGAWMSSYYGHDAAFVLDAGNLPIHAMTAGESRPLDAFSTFAPAVLPQIADLRRSMASRTDPAEAGIVRVAAIGGAPVIISVTPLVPSTERLTVEPGTEYVHVAIRWMNQTFLARLGERYLISDVRFIAAPEGADQDLVIPVEGISGPLAYLSWTPARPGLHMVAHTWHVFLLALVCLFATSGWLLKRLRRLATTLHDSEAQAQHDSLHDALTGLPNRTLFNQRLDAALDATARSETCALLYVDLDRFKHVNDTLGHPAGDDLIRQVGERLFALRNENDTVARLGGDEFALILRGLRGWRDAQSFASRIIEALKEPFTLGEDIAFVDSSIGIAVAPEAAIDRTELMRKADIALYQAKGSGKGRFCMFEASLDEVVRQKRAIERDLREALDQEIGLKVVYQPLFAIDGKTLVGAEALTRWDHPVHGFLSPSVFVAVAEERGLISRLGAWVLREACRTAKDLALPWIAVNVSSTQFRDPNFVDFVLDLLSELALSPERLQIEITEGLLLDASEAVSSAMLKLRFAGVQIALDDFGTGYSSLQYLHRYKVDKIKIDRSFVRLLDESGQSDAIVRAMVQLAAALDLHVTAEGVETREQWVSLAAIGDPELQGYLFSQPLTPEALNALLHGPAAAGPEAMKRA